jgi:hypothetical protein
MPRKSDVKPKVYQDPENLSEDSITKNLTRVNIQQVPFTTAKIKIEIEVDFIQVNNDVNLGNQVNRESKTEKEREDIEALELAIEAQEDLETLTFTVLARKNQEGAARGSVKPSGKTKIRWKYSICRD